MRNQCHPRENEAREADRLQGGKGITKSEQKMEMQVSKMCLDVMHIAQQAGKEPEEWLLSKVDSFFLMPVGKDQNNDTRNFCEVMNLRRDIVCIPMVPGQVDDKPRQSVQSKELFL